MTRDRSDAITDNWTVPPSDIKAALQDLWADGHQYVKARDLIEHLPVESPKEITAQMAVAERRGWWEAWAPSSKQTTYRITIED